MIIFNACFTRKAISTTFSSLIHASLFLHVWNDVSTKPIARWSLTGASLIWILFLVQKVFTSLQTKHCAWYSRIERGITWILMYMTKNFKTFAPIAFLYLHAVWYLEKRSIAAKKKHPLPFLSETGPPKSICSSWFGSTHGICGRHC